MVPSATEDKVEKKSLVSWAAARAAKLAAPIAHGSKEVPDGAPDALAGLSLVFTGELTSFERERKRLTLRNALEGEILFLFLHS